jgi:hypothetical protein
LATLCGLALQQKLVFQGAEYFPGVLYPSIESTATDKISGSKWVTVGYYSAQTEEIFACTDTHFVTVIFDFYLWYPMNYTIVSYPMPKVSLVIVAWTQLIKGVSCQHVCIAYSQTTKSITIINYPKKGNKVQTFIISDGVIQKVSEEVFGCSTSRYQPNFSHLVVSLPTINFGHLFFCLKKKHESQKL